MKIIFDCSVKYIWDFMMKMLETIHENHISVLKKD